MYNRSHIIFGAMTSLLGLLCFFFLLDSPTHCVLRLTEGEKRISEERTKDNAVVRHQRLKWRQMLESFTEIRYYCINLAVMGLNMQNGALQVFSAQFIKQLGDFTVNNKRIIDVYMPSSP